MAWKNVQYENGKYKTSSGGGGGASEFADLDDVSFSNLQNGQIPKYNSTTQKWENANESGGANAHHYSTSEHVIGTWIDGKPLYEKTIEFGACPDSAEKFVAHNISNLKMITKLYGITSNSTGGTFPLPFVNVEVSPGYQIVLRATATDVVVRAGSDRTAFTNTYITIEYTKTTD